MANSRRYGYDGGGGAHSAVGAMIMIQCRDCEFYRESAGGVPRLTCDPFKNIKEPECLVKWQLVKLDILVRSHQATMAMYERLAPLQERMMKHMERELDEADDADSWKYIEGEEEEEIDEPGDVEDEGPGRQ